MSERVNNVRDARHSWIGSWEVAPLVYEELTAADVGRTVIYRNSFAMANPNRWEPGAGTLSSWRDRIVFVRFSRGDTAAGCRPCDLVFGVRAMDGDLTRGDLTPDITEVGDVPVRGPALLEALRASVEREKA